MKCFVFLVLFAAVAFAAEPARPPQPARPAAKQPPDPRIAALVLSQVNFRELDFPGALEYFRRKAEQQSGGALKLTFKQILPEDFRPRHELSLDLRGMPFMIALNYLGELAGVQFTVDGTTITAKAGEAPPPKYAPLPQDAPSKVQGSGALLKPAESTANGNNTYRKTDGTLQPDKSGYIPHRSMGGWSIKDDPSNAKSVNCSQAKPCTPPCKCTCNCAAAAAAKAKTAK